MNGDELRALQAPLKAQYRERPETARVTLSASGQVNLQDLTCNVPTSTGVAVAGLHPAAGGPGWAACSGDMLLQALVACSGVTLSAVAAAMGVDLKSASLQAEGDLDFRGTLGVERGIPVGLTQLRLLYTLESPAEDATLAKLVELSERYCVVLQTLVAPPQIESRWVRM